MPQMLAPKNVNELRDGLATVFADLYNRTMEPKVAKEINNNAGKQINSARAQIELAAQNGVDAEIPWLAPKGK